MRIGLPAASAALFLLLEVAPTSGAEAVVSLAPHGRQPRAAVSPAGVIAVVYGEGDQIICRTSADGRTFGAAIRVGEIRQLMLGGRRGPQIAAVGAGFVVTAIGKRGDLVSWRSDEAGRSWAGPAVVNDVPASAREGLHGLAAGGGAVHVVWLDLRDGRTKVYTAASRDGEGWGANRLVYESPEGTVCECCQPTVAADEQGTVVIQWRNLVGGMRDMYLVRSSDGGRTFGPPAKLGNGRWPLQACPMDGGGVAVAGGRVTTVWRREDVVYAADPGAPEQPLGRGRNAVVAIGAAGLLRAWQTGAGDVVLQAEGAPATPVGRGGFASFGAAPGGKGKVVLVWEDPGKGAMVRNVVPGRTATVGERGHVGGGVDQPIAIPSRKSRFPFVLASLSSISSIASTGDRAESTLRRIQTRWSSSRLSSSSSLRVPDLLMSTAG
jgi:hypothetical protein